MNGKCGPRKYSTSAESAARFLKLRGERTERVQQAILEREARAEAIQRLNDEALTERRKRAHWRLKCLADNLATAAALFLSEGREAARRCQVLT